MANKVTPTELGYLSGATSNIQNQIDSMGGGGSVGVLLDCGALPVDSYEQTISVPGTTPDSRILVGLGYSSLTGKDPDDVEMDQPTVFATPYTDQIRFLLVSKDGYIHDKYYIVYRVG